MWDLDIVGDILQCEIDPLRVDFFQTSKANDAVVGVLTFGDSVLSPGRLRQRRRHHREDRSAAA
jgi:hypothetical protein